jgi:hypothetical protein
MPVRRHSKQFTDATTVELCLSLSSENAARRRFGAPWCKEVIADVCGLTQLQLAELEHRYRSYMSAESTELTDGSYLLFRPSFV